MIRKLILLVYLCMCTCVCRSTALQERQVSLQEKQERIKQLKADLNNKIE